MVCVPLRLLVQASEAKLLRSGRGSLQTCVSPKPPPSPHIPICPGSCLPGEEPRPGYPSFLTSDVTHFPIKMKI